MDWHIHQSTAFDELLVDPLRPFIDVQLVAWDGRSGDPLGNWQRRAMTAPVVFCQRPPAPELLKMNGARLVWIPMWDNVIQNWSSKEWWSSLPKSLRVVAFSEQVARMSEVAGLPTLRLRYHKDPAQFAQATWTDGRILLYWNRTGLFGPAFIKKLCVLLDVHDLYFRETMDPKIAPKAAYTLPAKIGKTVVHKVPRFGAQKDYFELLKRVNIYLALRAVEGVGLTFLEAMASGCAVFGYNAPTMNEYITHGVDGYLFESLALEKRSDSLSGRLIDAFQTWVTGQTPLYPLRLSECQNWDELERTDLEALGQSARRRQELGFISWKKQISDYASFIMDW